jgi:hypothetical protein
MIDMQPCYPASEVVLDEVIREVKRARTNKEWVMILEYGTGRTYYRITRELQGYRRRLYARKYKNDGAAKVFTAITRRNNNLDNKNVGRIEKIRVCGVNTNACVFDTVNSLKILRYPIEVLAHATAQFCIKCKYQKFGTCIAHHRRALRQMKRWKNVTIRRTP